MDSLIVLMAQHMTVTAIAEMIDEHDTRIWRVLEHYVLDARSQEDFSKVKSVGVDETSRAKGHKYVSVFIDLDKSKVVHVCEGKDASTIESFRTDLELHKGSSKNINNFCCDMSPAFISGIENNFPNASITFDKFHVMKIMNDAMIELGGLQLRSSAS
jgi:transposase